MSEEKFADVLKSNIPVLVDFHAPWCQPCKMMEPIIEKLAEEYEGRVKFVAIDTSKYPRAASKYYIRSVPTFIIFIDGKPMESRVGVTYESVFREWLDKWAPVTQLNSIRED